MSTFRRVVQKETVIAAGVADQVVTYDVSDFRHCILSVGSSSDADFKMEVKGAIVNRPDFTVSRSNTNIWDKVDIVDLEDGASIDGDTGVTFSAADARLFEVNINSLNFLCIHQTAYVAGTMRVFASFTTDD